MRFTHRAWEVNAVQWTGDNFPEVERFIAENVGNDCGTRCDYDPDYKFSYNIVQFSTHEDYEVEEGDWIVVHRPPHDPHIEIMCETLFREAYERAVTPPPNGEQIKKGREK
jgi:hypothetical protein